MGESVARHAAHGGGMTFLAYLAAQPDWTCRYLTEALSGLPDGSNDLGVVVAHLRGTLGGSEAALAVEEAAYRWREWRRTVKESLTVGISEKTSPE